MTPGAEVTGDVSTVTEPQETPLASSVETEGPGTTPGAEVTASVPAPTDPQKGTKGWIWGLVSALVAGSGAGAAIIGTRRKKDGAEEKSDEDDEDDE